MRVALALVAVIALVAGLFAIWPAIADAPWEDQVKDSERSSEIWCEAALELRRTALNKIEPARPVLGGFSQPRTNDIVYDMLDQAEREISRYC